VSQHVLCTQAEQNSGGCVTLSVQNNEPWMARKNYSYREVTMARRLANKGRRNMPKNTDLGKRSYDSYEQKIFEYQKRIRDLDYVEFAIDRIAAELTHFLTR